MATKEKPPAQTWWVYILKCADNTLYTGVTTDVERRLDEHNHEKLGAKYTKARRPVRMIYQEMCKNRSEACQRESAIKKLKRSEKLALVDAHCNAMLLT